MMRAFKRFHLRFIPERLEQFYRSYSIQILGALSFAALFIILLIIVPRSLKAQKWFIGSTKLASMQSLFQLGTATSIAFAVAGPQIQHALGPRVKGAVQKAKLMLAEPNAPIEVLARLIKTLNSYDRYKKELVGYTRGNLYSLHLSAVSFNILLLFWSSLIDPGGHLPNAYAFLIGIISMAFPLIDLFDAFREARHVRPLLQEAKDACGSGMPEKLEAASAAIEAEIKPFPTNI